MKKRLLTGVLALAMILQTFIPSLAKSNVAKTSESKLLSKELKVQDDNLITLGEVKGINFSKLNPSASIIIEKAEENKNDGLELGDELIPQAVGSSGSQYIDGQQPADPDKPKYWANVQGTLTTRGIDGTTFDWDKVLGQGTKVKLLFTQTNGNVMTGVTYSLLVDKDGTYTWQGSDGKPTYLPLFDVDGKAYSYNVQIERTYSKDIQLIIQESNGTPKAAFREEDGKHVATISFLDIKIQQVASTKFVSEWHTDLAEADRPQIEGYFRANDDADNDFNFPLNNTSKTVLRYGFEENFVEDEENGPWSFLSSEIEKTPKTVEVKTTTQGLTFEENNGVKTVKSGDHKFKYDFAYDVINGGKLVMTEIIPLTFDANGGKFDSITVPNAEQKIVKEVEYGKDLEEKVENPKKDSHGFKGWGIMENGKLVPVTSEAFKNVKKATTFYAIWKRNKISANELEVKESYRVGTKYVNDFIPTLDDLKGQVKIKDASGTLQPLLATDQLIILDDNKKPIADADLKDKLYDKLKEEDTTEVSREVLINARVMRNNKPFPVTIKIKVIKNIYEAKTEEGKPVYVPTGYVKVTVDPTIKATEPQKYFYYVNPEAKVPIKRDNPVGVGANTFVKWANGNTEYKLDGKERYQFKDATTITAEYTTDVIPADANGNKAEGTPDNFVKVTFVPTDKATDTAEKIYWVNPEKEVTIPVENPVGKEANTFKEWKIGENADGDVYTVGIAKKFEQETTITATYVDDVIEQTDPNSKPNEIPDYYVKVTTKKTDKAKLSTDPVEKEEQIFWVNPKKEVSLPVTKPVGKDVPVDGNNPKEFTWKFTEWKSNENGPRTWKENVDKEIKDKFPAETTITAQYEKVIKDQGNVSAEGLTVAESFKDGDNWINNFIPSEDTLKKAIKVKDASGTEQNVPDDANVEFILGKDASGADYTDLAAELYDKLKEKENDKENGIEKPSRIETVKAKVTFKNGEVQDVEIPIKVIKNIYEAKTETERPFYVPENYVKVTLDPTTKAKEPQKTYYYVNPEAKVLIPGENPTAISGFTFVNWTTPGKNADGNDIDAPYELKERHKFEKETTITANYVNEKDIIEFDPKKPVAKPEGFITVSFDADLGLKLTDIKFYHVKIGAKDTNGKLLTLAALTKPKYQAASGYEFNGWDKLDSTPIGKDDIVVTALAKFTPSKPDDRPSYPEIIYRDKIVEKEKIVEKIVKVGENDELLKEIRYMQGFNGKFRPYDGLTRAEAAQILANALKADGYRYDANYALSYSDVGSKWYTDAVRVVTQANVFQGYSDGTFRPQSKITRAEWVATLRRFQDLKKANGNAMMLKNGHWATAEVEAAYEAGWLGVYQDGTAHFDADKPITRQEVAYVSNRAFRRVLDKIYLKRSVNTLLTYKDINPSMPLYEDILCASNTLLTDGRYYKANTIVMDNVTFNIVTDYLRISQKKFQYNVIR